MTACCAIGIKMLIFAMDIRTMERNPGKPGPEDLVDAGGRERILALPAGKKRSQSVAGNLLLQYGLEIFEGREQSSCQGVPALVSGEEVLSLLRERGPARYDYLYGPHGKPYFADPGLPYFNLSHSGDYVVVALAGTECGIDLQKREEGKNLISLAERFFTPGEAEKVRLEGEPAFYRLWTRKEAYGKCTGEGIARALKIDPEDGSLTGDLEWMAWDGQEGYYLAACRKIPATGREE